MNIGFISTWFERGAAYVTKAYIELLETHNIFIYARGGEYYALDDSNWNKYNVTWGYRLSGTNINKSHFYKWIKDNNIELLFFNEQHEFEILASIKKSFPNIKIGSYIDYYKEDTIELFDIYDFIICNTKRHAFAFRNHPQMFYIPWGTDIELFSNEKKLLRTNEQITFFHSAGMSQRKGTDLLIQAFLKGELYKNSKLIIHTQVDINNLLNDLPKNLEKFNIEVINKTVTAPGLYYLGDVYVYPTKLEGLGLTLYEALASGLPVITTDTGPMNEIINNENGALVQVDYYYSRKDAYYWPMAVCNIDDLIYKMKFYIENYENMEMYSLKAREYAVNNLNWKERKDAVEDAFINSRNLGINSKAINRIEKYYKNTRINALKKLLPNNKLTYSIKKIMRK